MNPDLYPYAIPNSRSTFTCRESYQPANFLEMDYRRKSVELSLENEDISDLLEAFTLLTDAYIENFSINVNTPYSMQLAFENDMSDFSERLAQEICEAYQNALERGLGIHDALNAAAEQAERGLRSLAAKLDRYDNEFKTWNMFRSYWDKGYARCLFASEQGEHTCDRCNSYHGRVFSSREVPIPPLHPRCRCELVLMDTAAEALYNMNRHGFLEAFHQARSGPEGGVFLLDHEFFRRGVNSRTLTRLTFPDGHVIVNNVVPLKDNSEEQFYQYFENRIGPYFT